jgi:26S proteasome regulatory subunit N9
MKSLSLGLMKGVIDELTQSVSITWVQPRVLDLKQVHKMKDRLDKWLTDVDQVLLFVQNETAPELLS